MVKADNSLFPFDEQRRGTPPMDVRIALAEALVRKNSARYIPVDANNPPPSSIIISPTTDGGTIGHVGIVGYDGLVYSNSSGTGLWSQNYTVSSWNRYFDARTGTGKVKSAVYETTFSEKPQGKREPRDRPFRLEAVDYHLKPRDPEQVTEAVNRLLAYFEGGADLTGDSCSGVASATGSGDS